MDDKHIEPPAKSQDAGCEKRKPANMHEDIPVWHDCCSCEAEPYWVEIAEQMDLDQEEAGKTDTPH